MVNCSKKQETHSSWYLPSTNRSSIGNTHTRFLGEVSQLIQFQITNHTNVVLLVDFNVHAQDIENPDSLVYNDIMEGLGLQQQINKPMHKLGNTLGLIYMESPDRVKVLHSFIGKGLDTHNANLWQF